MKRKSRLRSFWNRKQWIVRYLNPWLEKRDLDTYWGPRHLLFLFVDHFEPGHGGANRDRQLERVAQWLRLYPAVVGPFEDCEGCHPRHTWFYLGEEGEHLKQLGELCFRGLGEVELHIHHGPKDSIPDPWKKNSRQDLARFIEKQKSLFTRYGALITAEAFPQKIFGFLHGMFALDNSLPDYCGVSGELELLRELGCYGDFTFPAPGKSQPPLINRLYYPTGDPEAGKSYFQGEEIMVGSERRNGVLIFQGPLGLKRKGLMFQVEDGHLDWNLQPTRSRILDWISKGIHVQGRPEWIFVKVYTHGCMENNLEKFLGPSMARLHHELREVVLHEPSLLLHYVSAREAFNIAMAAMAGKEGDPGQYRNFLFPPYANTVIRCNRPYQMGGYSGKGWALDLLETGEVVLEVKGDWQTEIKGEYLEAIRLNIDEQKGEIFLQARGQGKIKGTFRNQKRKGPFTGSVGQEGEVTFSGLPDNSGLSFSGSFSAQGLLDFGWGFQP